MTREERREKRKRDTRNAVIAFIFFILVLAGLVLGAVFLLQNYLSNRPEKPENTEEMTATETEESELPVVPVVPEEPMDDAATEQAKAFVSSMTLEQKVAQMFMITPDALTGVSGATAAGDATKSAYTEKPVGGIIYMSANLTGTEQTQTMLANMQAYSRELTGLPIFLGVDEEGGTVSRIASNMEYGIADVGDMSEIGASGDPQNAYTVGITIGGYLSNLGFNVDFAPVADVLTNPENTVVQYRSFGSDSEMVKNMVLSELQGLQENHVYGVVKHFPGQGSTAGDSHNGPVSTDKTLDQLKEAELIPFQGAIDSGADFIMVGHISVPGITGNDMPSSLSEYMINEVLRNQMGYDGIVITDAMNTAAITSSYNSSDATVTAILAGADMVLMPEDFGSAYSAVLQAVSNGTITEERINESVVRIVRVKQKMNQ